MYFNLLCFGCTYKTQKRRMAVSANGLLGIFSAIIFFFIMWAILKILWR